MRKLKSLPDFIRIFPDDHACRVYLCEQKWGKGFNCSACGHDTALKGRTWYYRKCQRCHHDESCTVNTLYHKLKFPIHSAFLMTYLICTSRKGISTCELARQFSIHQNTAWYFKRKVQQAMSLGVGSLMSGVVEVDETLIGGKEKGKQGHSHSKKLIVQIAIETDRGTGHGQTVKRMRARLVAGFKSEHLRVGLLSNTMQGSFIVTDKLRAYKKAADEYLHIPLYSEEGQNFEKLHWMIFNLKNWIRGTHHKVSSMHIQRYLDEFCFRFNHRNYASSGLEWVMSAMVYSQWLPYSKAVGN